MRARGMGGQRLMTEHNKFSLSSFDKARKDWILALHQLHPSKKSLPATIVGQI